MRKKETNHQNITNYLYFLDFHGICLNVQSEENVRKQTKKTLSKETS